MTLQMNLENLEGLDEATAKLYTEKDGKFTLDVTGHEKTADKGTIPLSRLNQEIEKRKASDSALTELADELKKDVPEEKEHLIPDLPPLKLVKWLRKALAEGIFETKSADGIDTKKAGAKTPANFEGLSPQAIMSQGYSTK